MAKKKDKPQVINNIQELNLEIDYDKLAQAIVKAQEEIQEKNNGAKSFTSSAFATITSLAFRGVAILGWIVAFAMIVATWNIFITLEWLTLIEVIKNIMIIVVGLALFLMIFLYSLLLWKAAKEIEKEKDRNYIIAVFSGIVSLAALIVALVALFKEVG